MSIICDVPLFPSLFPILFVFTGSLRYKTSRNLQNPSQLCHPCVPKQTSVTFPLNPVQNVQHYHLNFRNEFCTHSKDVRLPQQLQRAMAAEAEAAREARAKVSIQANEVTFLFLVKTLVYLFSCREQWPLKQRQFGMLELRLNFCETFLRICYQI